MFESGLIEEVRSLLAHGVPRDARPMESLGYKQALEVLDGNLTLEQAIADTQMQTRRYAKRQWTWFRRDSEVRWLSGFGNEPETAHLAASLASQFLPSGEAPDIRGE
jgi:tRNA dimethylallyltransferase